MVAVAIVYELKRGNFDSLIRLLPVESAALKYRQARILREAGILQGARAQGEHAAAVRPDFLPVNAGGAQSDGLRHLIVN